MIMANQLSEFDTPSVGQRAVRSCHLGFSTAMLIFPVCRAKMCNKRPDVIIFDVIEALIITAELLTQSKRSFQDVVDLLHVTQRPQ
jgi:hypothetical protein